MEVTFTGSWYDETAEKEGANKLIENGCVLISQHAASMGAPTACETAGVPNVSYNGSTQSACPNTFIVSSRIDWAPYFKYIINAEVNGEEIAADWCEGLEAGAVKLTDVNEAAAAAGTGIVRQFGQDLAGCPGQRLDRRQSGRLGAGALLAGWFHSSGIFTGRRRHDRQSEKVH
jgi:basic membrane protein A